MNVEPLPSTMATLYAWAWMTREKSWLEGLASLTITEWANDDRLLHDVGGGLSSRMAKRWMDDLGFGWEQMPNFKVHSEADEEHSDMFLEDLEKFATGERETQVYQAAKESMDLLKIFRGGIAKEMERLFSACKCSIHGEDPHLKEDTGEARSNEKESPFSPFQGGV